MLNVICCRVQALLHHAPLYKKEACSVQQAELSLVIWTLQQGKRRPYAIQHARSRLTHQRSSSASRTKSVMRPHRSPCKPQLAWHPHLWSGSTAALANHIMAGLTRSSSSSRSVHGTASQSVHSMASQSHGLSIRARHTASGHKHAKCLIALHQRFARSSYLQSGAAQPLCGALSHSRVHKREERGVDPTQQPAAAPARTLAATTTTCACPNREQAA